jgi:hypothetical protein
MTQFSFGTGNIYVLPPSALTPIKLGAIQDVAVDFDGDLKQLFGQNQFPVDNARGKVKITGKIGSGKISASAWNTMFFGQTLATGQVLQVVGEAGTIGSSPYTYTTANAANFLTDLGVFDATTGKQYTRVASGPTTGQYTMASGVYTFAAADTGKAILVDYEYNSATTGQTITGNNVLMGTIPTFALHLNNNTKGQQTTLRLYAVVAPKLQFPFKLDDYMISTVDFAAQDDGTGKVFSWSTTET